MFSLFAYEEDKKTLSLDPQDEDEWQRVNFGIDSCAATSCINKDLLPGWPLLKAKGPITYTSASKSSIDVLGAKRPLCWLQDGQEVNMNLKVLDQLQSALFAVSELVQSCRVVFDLEKHGGSYLEHRRDGRRNKVYARNNTYVLPVWFKKRPDHAQLAAQFAELNASGGDPFMGRPL